MEATRNREVINKLDVALFLKPFSVEEQAAELVQQIKGLDSRLAERLLRLVEAVRKSEKDFFIRPITHPLGERCAFANVATVELSEKCFRLNDWRDELLKKYPEFDRDTVSRLINRYVYLRHLR